MGVGAVPTDITASEDAFLPAFVPTIDSKGLNLGRPAIPQLPQTTPSIPTPRGPHRRILPPLHLHNLIPMYPRTEQVRNGEVLTPDASIEQGQYLAHFYHDHLAVLETEEEMGL